MCAVVLALSLAVGLPASRLTPQVQWAAQVLGTALALETAPTL